MVNPYLLNNESYDIRVDIVHSNDMFVSFNIFSSLNDRKLNIINYSTNEINKILVNENNPTMYYFDNSDFIDNKLRFEINNYFKHYVIEIKYCIKNQNLYKESDTSYFVHYFLAIEGNVLINNKESKIKWENAEYYHMYNEYLIDINKIFNLRYSNIGNIQAIYLVIHNNNLYENIYYSNISKGYIFNYDFYLLNSKINFKLKDYYYDEKTFQMSNVKSDNYKRINKIIIPKSFKDEVIDISLCLFINNKLISLRTSIYFDNFYNRVINI